MRISDRAYDILNDFSHLYAPFITMVLAILAVFLQDSTLAVVTAICTAVDGFLGISVKYFKAKWEKEHGQVN